MRHQIIHLPKATWQGTILPIVYTTKEYYDVQVTRNDSGFNIALVKKDLAEPFTHLPEQYGFPDRLYNVYRPESCAWGIIDEGQLIAAIETCTEEWSDRLRITELWVDTPYQKQGIGHALMQIVKQKACAENKRAVILETQSCNVKAIDFYLREDFTLVGLDTCCYSNNDMEKKEVRLELGLFVV